MSVDIFDCQDILGDSVTYDSNVVEESFEELEQSILSILGEDVNPNLEVTERVLSRLPDEDSNEGSVTVTLDSCGHSVASRIKNVLKRCNSDAQMECEGLEGGGESKRIKQSSTGNHYQYFGMCKDRSQNTFVCDKFCPQSVKVPFTCDLGKENETKSIVPNILPINSKEKALSVLEDVINVIPHSKRSFEDLHSNSRTGIEFNAQRTVHNSSISVSSNDSEDLLDRTVGYQSVATKTLAPNDVDNVKESGSSEVLGFTPLECDNCAFSDDTVVSNGVCNIQQSPLQICDDSSSANIAAKDVNSCDMTVSMNKTLCCAIEGSIEPDVPEFKRLLLPLEVCDQTSSQPVANCTFSGDNCDVLNQEIASACMSSNDFESCTDSKVTNFSQRSNCQSCNSDAVIATGNCLACSGLLTTDLSKHEQTDKLRSIDQVQNVLSTVQCAGRMVVNTKELGNGTFPVPLKSHENGAFVSEFEEASAVGGHLLRVRGKSSALPKSHGDPEGLSAESDVYNNILPDGSQTAARDEGGDLCEGSQLETWDRKTDTDAAECDFRASHGSTVRRGVDPLVLQEPHKCLSVNNLNAGLSTGSDAVNSAELNGCNTDKICSCAGVGGMGLVEEHASKNTLAQDSCHEHSSDEYRNMGGDVVVSQAEAAITRTNTAVVGESDASYSSPECKEEVSAQAENIQVQHESCTSKASVDVSPSTVSSPGPGEEISNSSSSISLSTDGLFYRDDSTDGNTPSSITVLEKQTVCSSSSEMSQESDVICSGTFSDGGTEQGMLSAEAHEGKPRASSLEEHASEHVERALEKETKGNEVNNSSDSFAVGSVTVPRDTSKDAAATCRKKQSPYKSNDPEENHDIEHPDWETVKKLETDEERYKQVRSCWKSNRIPDPNRDLTYHNFRKRLSNLHPRPASKQQKRRIHDADPWVSGQCEKNIVPCTQLIDLKIQSLERRLSETENNIRTGYWKEAQILNEQHERQRYAFAVQQGICNFAKANRALQNVPYPVMRFQRTLDFTQEHERRKLVERYDCQVMSLRKSFMSKLDALREAQVEVNKFCSFYKGLEQSSNDPTILTEKQMEELIEIEHMYDNFVRFYASPDKECEDIP